jgi:ATP-dependent helicase/DNAse subunit B
MVMTLVTGPANAGKTGHIVRSLFEATLAGQMPILLLPSGPEVLRAQSEIAPREPIGVMVTQLDRYLDGLWMLEGDGRRIVSRVQRLSLLASAIADTRLALLADSAKRRGFVSSLEEVARRAGECLALDAKRSGYARRGTAAAEICAVVDAYATLLQERGLIERSEAHARLPDVCERQSIRGPVLINRFASFTPPQERFVTWLSRSGVDVTVALTWAEGHPATEGSDALVHRLASLPGTVAVTVGGSYSDIPELRRLERKLFRPDSDPASVSPPTGAVVLSEGTGASGEAQRIVREIQEMAESGIARGEIAVVLRNTSSAQRELSDAMQEAGIPYEIDAERPLVHTGLGRALLMLLQYADQGQRRTDLLGFLRSGYAWAAARDVDALDERLRTRRAKSGAAVARQAAMLDARTATMMADAVHLSRQKVHESGLMSWRQLLAEMLRAQWRTKPLSGEAGRLDAAARGVVLDAVVEIASLGGGAGMREVIELLREASVTIRSLGDPDRVQIMSAERARSRRFAAVICAGLQAGEFPVRARDDVLSGGDVGSDLAAAGIDLSPRTDLPAERLLFYQVVTGARTKLVLSRAACDDEGKPLRRSVFWDELLDLYRDPTAEQEPGGPPSSYAGLPPLRSLGLADLAESPDAPRAERRTLRDAVSRGDVRQPRVRLALARSRAREDRVTGEAARALRERETFSVSELEAYLRCPYLWFYERRLSGEPLDRQIDPLERGKLAHEVMQRFYVEWQTEGHERVTPESLSAALELAERISAEVLSEAMPPSSLYEEEMHHRARAGVRRVIERDALSFPGFVPRHHEWAFGDEKAVDLGSFRLRGRIDRIDVGEAGLVVSDYKGSVVTPRKRFATDGVVQVPLYALIASRALGVPIAGGLYRSMGTYGDRGFFLCGAVTGPGLVSTDACDEAEIADLIKEAEGRAADAVAGIREGLIPATPSDTAACERCSARGVCEASA